MKNIYELLDRIRVGITGAFAQIERDANLPHKCFSHHYMWAEGKENGRPFPEKAVGNLLRFLTRIYGGVRVGDWFIVSDQETPSHTGIKNDETRPLIVEEVGNSFEYYEPQLRVLYDDFDVCNI